MTTPADDRRRQERGAFPRTWNLLFGLLRKLAGHAETFYGAVGIFLIAGATIAVIATMGFSELAEHVLKGSTQSFDVAILQWLHLHQSPPLTALMIEMTYLGTGTVVMMIVCVAAMFLWHTEHKHSARLLLAATAGNILLNNALKLVYHRSRPSVSSGRQRH